jgi:hypothetical protein
MWPDSSVAGGDECEQRQEEATFCEDTPKSLEHFGKEGMTERQNLIDTYEKAEISAQNGR